MSIADNSASPLSLDHVSTIDPSTTYTSTPNQPATATCVCKVARSEEHVNMYRPHRSSTGNTARGEVTGATNSKPASDSDVRM